MTIARKDVWIEMTNGVDVEEICITVVFEGAYHHRGTMYDPPEAGYDNVTFEEDVDRLEELVKDGWFLDEAEDSYDSILDVVEQIAWESLDSGDFESYPSDWD